ncbi:hypothetical protein DAEQUDRAFT_270096 [Daedalea quercina L-15889]|uniref:Uncharacterized protein n=1 Tax=Daedalea quercina L-15889 TaxID=1314783 RepID=A0A165QBP7_9APHY|nr:hypothetical protein DAEQUDRAFT_270096 [Daedalea quercina L-15889]
MHPARHHLLGLPTYCTCLRALGPGRMGLQAHTAISTDSVFSEGPWRDHTRLTRTTTPHARVLPFARQSQPASLPSLPSNASLDPIDPVCELR